MPRNERSLLAEIVGQITPLDDVEEHHRLETLAWIASGAELYRYEKPDCPRKHLVAYAALVDLDARSVLLVDHRNARRWLPTGGHVEPNEDPAATARRELREELGIEAGMVSGLSSNPLLITQTTTVGLDAGHVDVSLWYAFTASHTTPLDADENEFAGIRWWTFDEVDDASTGQIDPHLQRFLDKLRRDLATPTDGRVKTP